VTIKKIILIIVGVLLFLAVYLLSKITGCSGEPSIHQMCDIVSPVSVKRNWFSSLLNFQMISEFEFEIKNDSQTKKIKIASPQIPDVHLSKEKLIFVERFYEEKNVRNIELLSDTSCKLYNSFVDQRKIGGINTFLGNPMVPIRFKLEQASKPIVLNTFLDMGFNILDITGNKVKLHSYPAITLEVVLDQLNGCSQIECLGQIPVFEIANLYQQFIIQNDDGKIIQISQPKDYYFDEEKFPIKMLDLN